MSGRIVVQYADVVLKNCLHCTIIKESTAAKSHLYAKHAVSICYNIVSAVIEQGKKIKNNNNNDDGG